MKHTTLASCLKAARQRRGLTLREVADRTNDQVANSYISRLENGRCTNPGIGTLWLLAKVYKVDYHTLCKLAGYGYELVGGPRK